mgnify:CR=1 FL=1
MKNKPPKLCIDCAYVYKEPVFYYNSQVTYYNYKCARTSPVNLVTGAKISLVDCDDQRAQVSSTPDRCGVKGKYWEKACRCE